MKHRLGDLPLTISFLTIVTSLIFVGSAFAQLTDADIAELQKRAEVEGWTFEVGENDATTFPLDQLCGLKEPPDWQSTATFDPMPKITRDIPEAFDWRDHNGCTPIRNQAGCGSCWAFSTVGALECNILIQDGVVEDLSEQWLVSCNRHGWSCDGGWFAHGYHLSYKDICDSTGAVLEADYPYVGWDAACECPDPHPYLLDSWAYIGGSGSVPGAELIKQAILEYGPVSVAVHVNSAFQGYNGGVFNGCGSGEINHAVVLVGWDDSQGYQGVWIMRNSWGPGWGEDGYMRIMYGCSQIGYAANYVNYNGGVGIFADTNFGWVPLEVNFQAYSGLEVDSWKWYFGDGDSALGQYVSHTYNTAGMHDVSIEIDAGGEIYTRTRPNFIVTLADTLKAPDIHGNVGTTVELIVSARNNVPLQSLLIPVEYAGTLGLTLDSFSTVGCRTDYFEEQRYINSDPNNKRKTISLICSYSGSSPYLEPGEGPVASLFFKIALGAQPDQVANIDLDGYMIYNPSFSWPLLAYAPVTVSGTVSLCLMHGDVDGTPGIAVSDLSYLVDHLFKGGPPAIPPETADVDCNTEINVTDLTYLVDYLFKGGAAPPQCCD